jgi:uncharacterized membrane protein YdbT with pleckstrin-like domain
MAQTASAWQCLVMFLTFEALQWFCRALLFGELVVSTLKSVKCAGVFYERETIEREIVFESCW